MAQMGGLFTTWDSEKSEISPAFSHWLWNDFWRVQFSGQEGEEDTSVDPAEPSEDVTEPTGIDVVTPVEDSGTTSEDDSEDEPQSDDADDTPAVDEDSESSEGGMSVSDEFSTSSAATAAFVDPFGFMVSLFDGRFAGIDFDGWGNSASETEDDSGDTALPRAAIFDEFVFTETQPESPVATLDDLTLADMLSEPEPEMHLPEIFDGWMF